MTYTETLLIWIVSNTVSLLTALGMLGMNIRSGVAAIKRGSDPIDKGLFARQVLTGLLLVTLAAAFLLAGAFTLAQPHPPAFTGQERVSGIAIVLTGVAVLVALHNIAAIGLDMLIDHSLRRLSERTAAAALKQAAEALAASEAAEAAAKAAVVLAAEVAATTVAVAADVAAATVATAAADALTNISPFLDENTAAVQENTAATEANTDVKERTKSSGS